MQTKKCRYAAEEHCENYTKMVWGSSRHVGVGVAQNCHDASALAGGLDIPICQTYIIIHLAPKGNTPPRSQCFDGRDCKFIEVTDSKIFLCHFAAKAIG